MPVFSQENADRIEKRFEKQKAPKSVPATKPKLIKDGPTPAGANEIRFILTDIKIENSSVYSQERLANFYTSLLKREISMHDVYKIRDKITALYGNDGYVLSRAYLPKQEIENGIVRINIIEGYVDEVVLEGIFGKRKPLFEAYANKIKAERPFNIHTLERYTLLARDLPGVFVKTNWQKSKNNPSAATIKYQVSVDRAKTSGSLSIDNRGTEANGPVQVTPAISLTNPFGYFSDTNILYASTTDTKELRYFLINHNQTLNSEGTKFNLSATYSKAEPGTELLNSIEQNSKSKTISLSLSHPVIRTRKTNWSLSGAIEARDSESMILGTKSSEDKLRVLSLSSNFDYSDSYGGINQMITEWRRGFSGLGATNNNSSLKTRSDGVVDFNKFTLYLSRTQNLHVIDKSLNKWQLFAALNGQYSKDALLSSEECGVGGKQFGRAYDSSELTGEHCLAIEFEARYQFEIDSHYLNSLQAYGFWDKGEVRNNNPSLTVIASESIESVGAGIRFGLKENIVGSVEFAKPLTREVANESNKDMRVFASLSVKF